MITRTFRIILSEEPEGGYTVTVPALTGCITYGESIAHAKKMAREAIEIFIEELLSRGEDIPDDSNTFEYSLTLVTA